MNLNSFQKNPFVNNSVGATSSYKSKQFTNYDKLGRKTVEEVQQEMAQAKYGDFQEKLNKRAEEAKEPPKQTNSLPDFKGRVDSLRKIHRG